MNSPSSNPCPFVAGSMITDPRYFVGRREQLDRLTSSASGVQPTSINVVGKRRIGKSSLLYRFCQTYEQRLQASKADPQKYVAIYLSLQGASCQTQSDFYQAVAQEFLKRPSVKTNPSLTTPLSRSSLDNKSFAEAMFAWKDAQVLPILCLDQIEALFQYPQEFNNGFFNNLRSLLDSNALMVIISSYESLDVYSRQHRLPPSFFSLGHVLSLEEITPEEATDLVRLPKTNDPMTPALSREQWQIALQWGGRNPYLLQLAALLLWEAGKRHRPVKWAKQQFDQQAKRVPGWPVDGRRIWRGFRLVIGDLPKGLFLVTKTIGTGVNEVIGMGFGVIVICLLFFALFRLITWLDFSQQIKGLLCSAWGSAIAQWCEAK